MRKIDKILRYNFTRETRKNLAKIGIINGCGGKGGFNFSIAIRQIFRDFKKFDNFYAKQLFFDIERLCEEHDFDYFAKNGFYKSNYIFAKGVKNLIKNWAGFFERRIIFWFIFFSLNKYGKKYYKK